MKNPSRLEMDYHDFHELKYPSRGIERYTGIELQWATKRSSVKDGGIQFDQVVAGVVHDEPVFIRRMTDIKTETWGYENYSWIVNCDEYIGEISYSNSRPFSASSVGPQEPTWRPINTETVDLRIYPPESLVGTPLVTYLLTARAIQLDPKSQPAKDWFFVFDQEKTYQLFHKERRVLPPDMGEVIQTDARNARVTVPYECEGISSIVVPRVVKAKKWIELLRDERGQVAEDYRLPAKVWFDKWVRRIEKKQMDGV